MPLLRVPENHGRTYNLLYDVTQDLGKPYGSVTMRDKKLLSNDLRVPDMTIYPSGIVHLAKAHSLSPNSLPRMNASNYTVFVSIHYLLSILLSDFE